MQSYGLREYLVTQTSPTPSRGFQVQAAEIIAGIVVDAPLDLEATAALCEDLTPLPSFAFGSDDKSSDILHELPGTLFFDE